jgi:protein kinase A
VVGKGGFGKVWKVRERGRGRVFAMKEMQKVKIVSKRSVHSVMNEQSLLRGMDSPFLVNMLASFQSRETLFLVMDYCNRGDLRYHLGNRRKFREEEARFFLACILTALQYMHARRVIHRDLKPENLVLDDKGYLRVTDLGVSREVKPNNAEDTSGTPGYMAPEVICKTNHSFPVDFFALGVIAYEFMTGRVRITLCSGLTWEPTARRFARRCWRSRCNWTRSRPTGGARKALTLSTDSSSGNQRRGWAPAASRK